MRYLCVHCEHRWDAEGEEAPTRCPACMRATGVKKLNEAADTPTPAAARKKPGVWLAGALFAVALGVGAYVGLRSGDAPEAVSSDAPSSRAALAAALAAEDVDAGTLLDLLQADAAIEAFAKQAAGNASGDRERAEAVVQAIRGRASALAFVPWSLSEPRPTPVATAGETLKKLQKDGGRAELYPLEVAALAVAALRSLDVPAMVAELIEVPGEKAPLEGSGYIGYYVVALPKAGAVYDPYGGRKLAETAKHAVLSDVQVMGAALALRAIHEVAYAGDPRSALTSTSDALRLASSLPSVRTARGVVVLNGRMVEQGLQEFTAASQLRPDAVRLHNLASAKLMTGDLESAEADLTRALERAPEFAGAQASLAALHMLRGDPDAARAAFEKAEQLAPDLSLVQWGMAEFALRTGEREQALARAQRALAARPSFDAKVRYGALLRQLGRFDDMRKTAHELMALSPEYRKADVRELIETVLGPTALDPIEPDPSADDLADLGGPDLNLQLGADSKLLAPDKQAAPSPEGAGEPILMMGDRKKLGLGVNKDLKLQLSEP